MNCSICGEILQPDEEVAQICKNCIGNLGLYNT
jgi:hypothetical protein